MKLRAQLAIAGVFITMLPLVTGRYVSEMHGVLRDTGQRELQTWTSAIEAVVENREGLDQGKPVASDIYAEYSGHEISLDGYLDDWSDLVQPPKLYQYTDTKIVGGLEKLASVSLKSSISDNALYLLFDIRDEKALFYDPRLGIQQNGDRLMLYVGHGNTLKRYMIRAIAPGHLNGFQIISSDTQPNLLLSDPSVKAFWEVKAGGYSIEVEMPRPERLSGFGFALIDSNEQNDSSDDAWIGTVNPTEPQLTGRIKFPSEQLRAHISGLAPEATRIRLFDEAGWLLADLNRLDELPESDRFIDPNESSFFDAVLYRFFSWLTRGDLIPEHPPYALNGPAYLTDSGLDNRDVWRTRYKSAGKALIGELRVLDGKSWSGFLLVERADESIAVIVNSTLVRLFGVLLLLFFSLLMGLYFYARWISNRIRRLNQATADALQQDGRIKIDMPGIKSGDEIGELSLSISDLLSRLSSYTEYLRLLASRLAHELRTPLAIVSTSLESVERKRLNDSDIVFFKRAEDATKRLQALIRSMSEATRLEQVVQNSELEVFDLLEWINTVAPLYQSLYPEKQISFFCKPRLTAASIMASAELLQQMLDKILANANDFTSCQGTIEIRLNRASNFYILDIVNEGSELPATLNNQLFDAMVSHRDGKQTEPHLGLGLYIVRLIVDKHLGSVEASNVERKFRIRIKFPAKD